MDKEIKNKYMRMTKPEPSISVIPSDIRTIRVFNLHPMAITLQLNFDGRMRSRKTSKLGRSIYSSVTADMSVDEAKRLIEFLQEAIHDV